MQDQQSATDGKIGNIANTQIGMLKDLRNRLDENTQLVARTKSYAERAAEALKLDWLRQLGADMKGLMQKILAMNLRIFQVMLEIRGRLPTHLERCLIHEPFMLEDAIGRIVPVYTQFISSWAAFESVLDIRFRNIPGHAKILSKEYILQEHVTGREISQVGSWEGTFLPGQRVNMSMLFVDSLENRHMCCPRCNEKCNPPPEKDIEW